MMKAMREIARNIEVTLFTNGSADNNTGGPATSTGATGTSRIMKNFQSFLTASAAGTVWPSVSTQYTLLILSNSAQATAITVNGFNNALEQAYHNGGNPEQAYVSPSVKRHISQFTATNQNRNIAATERQLVAALDLYYSDFGLIEIVLDRWVPQATNTTTATASSTDCRGNIFFLERAKNRLAFLRPMQHTLVGKRGDSVAGTVLTELTLECLNPTANVRVYGVNNVTA